MTLLQETERDIENSGHTIEDVDWVGSTSYGWFTWEEFAKLANFDYDSGYGAQEVATDLIVHFSDGQYMDRREYDGSEWWQYHKMILRPFVHRVPKTIGGGERFMWESISRMNAEEEEE